MSCYDYNTWTADHIWKRIGDDLPLETKDYSVCFEACELAVAIESKTAGVYHLKGSFADAGLKHCAHTKSTCLYLVDVERKLSKKDNHDSGLHVNLIWLDNRRKIMYRFDPYYARVIPDSLAMQEALDELVQKSLLPKGYEYKTLNIQLFPFGPQLLDSSATEARAEACGKEEFCVPWCMILVKTILEHVLHKKSTDIDASFEATMKQLKLPIPKTETEARKMSDKYYNAMRTLLGAD